MATALPNPSLTTAKFRHIGILGHPLRPATAQICAQVAAQLQGLGVTAWARPTWDADSVAPLVQESDLLVAIGGDGSMLRVARLAAPFGIPVFGINAGHLGFLTEVGLTDWPDHLPQLLFGQSWIEPRMMIDCELWRAGQRLHTATALNDVVINRGAVARSIVLETSINGGWTTTYNADALVVATATGSTAYALAAGGPILPPTLKNILVTPVAPHFSLDRPLVLDEGAYVEVVLTGEANTEGLLTVDGEGISALEPDDLVAVRSSALVSRFVRLREGNYFFRSLLDRMEPRSPRTARSKQRPANRE
jgi:NAD+ kinase